MTERFNFYDIYGYLLPGLLLFGLCWLPFGLASRGWPTEEVSKALFLVALAYIAGHMLQSVALVIVPSKVRDSNGVFRNPSSILLDANSTFTPAFKKNLDQDIQEQFGLEILGNADDALKNREVAFKQARAYLIHKEAASYVEQFEGLYAMMRGLACAFFWGTAYLLGWTFSFQCQNSFGPSVLLLLIVAAMGSLVVSVSFYRLKEPTAEQVRTLDISLSVFALIAGFGCGDFLGMWRSAPRSIEFFLFIASPITFVAGIRCMRAYRIYADSFAATVWKDFSAIYRDGKKTQS